MTFTFILSHPNNESSSVLVAIRHKGKRITVSTGVTDRSSAWDADAQRFRRTPTSEISNVKLGRWREKLLKVQLDAALEDNSDIYGIRNRLALLMDKNATEKFDRRAEILPYYAKWASCDTTRRKATRQMYYHYKTLDSYLRERMMEHATFRDMTYAFVEDYIEHLAQKGLKANTRGIHIKSLKTVMSDAFMKAIHDNGDFKKYRIEREEVDAVYLTTEEIGRIADLQLCGGIERSRDLFLIQCCTGLRYSDAVRVKAEDVRDGVLRKITQKTGAAVAVPASPTLMRVLEKWGGAPQISQQNLNSNLKTICRDAGIRDKVAVREDGREVMYEKCELVSSHTGRRSAATNMYLAGIPVPAIMKITGHKSEASFFRYLRITMEENAASLKSNPFFCN